MRWLLLCSLLALLATVRPTDELLQADAATHPGSALQNLAATRGAKLRTRTSAAGGHLRLPSVDKDVMLMAGAGEKTKPVSEADDDDEERKTLSQQIADGKYGLLQTEIYTRPPKRPGILSYGANPDVPRDTAKTLGGLEPEEIWLAEDHVLVIRGGAFPDHKPNRSDPDRWPPIDNYKAPPRQVKIPSNPKVPPPFPVQLTDGGPTHFIGPNGTTGPRPFFPPGDGSYFAPPFPFPPPPGNSTPENGPFYPPPPYPYPPPGNFPPGGGSPFSTPGNGSLSPPPSPFQPPGNGSLYGRPPFPLPPSGNFRPGNGPFYPPPPFPFPPPRNGTFFPPPLGFFPPLGNGTPPFFPALPPGAAFLPPPGSLNDTYDEDDPSIYYPPPYDFYYPSDNTTQVPPGPLVPGIILPPPPNFFAPLNISSSTSSTTSTTTAAPTTTTTTTPMPSTSIPTPPTPYGSRAPKPRPSAVYTPVTTSVRKKKPPRPPLITVSPDSVDINQISTLAPDPLHLYDAPKTALKPVLDPLVFYDTPTTTPKLKVDSLGYYHVPTTTAKAIVEDYYVPNTTPKRVSYYDVPITTPRTVLYYNSPKPTPKPVVFYDTLKSTQKPLPEPLDYYDTTKDGLSYKVPSTTTRAFLSNLLGRLLYTTASPPVSYVVVPVTDISVSNKYYKARPGSDIESNTVSPAPRPYRPRGGISTTVSPPRAPKTSYYFYEEPHIAQAYLRDVPPAGDFYYQPPPRSTTAAPPLYYYVTARPSQPYYSSPRPSPAPQLAYKSNLQYSSYDDPSASSKPIYQFSFQAAGTGQSTTPKPRYPYPTTPRAVYEYNYDTQRQSLSPRPQYVSSTASPYHAYYTPQDERLFDDITKKYFTIFGQKLASTTPLPPAEPEPLSLEGDVAVNYHEPRPPVNPDSEPVRPQSAAEGALISYRLPGNGAHFYFLTPQAVSSSAGAGGYVYREPQPRLRYRRRNQRRPTS